MRAWMMSMLLLVSAGAQAGSLLDLQVVDRESGRVLPVYSSGDKSWVPGVPGHRYSVRLVNRSHERVLAVLSVDGVNAVSGETASTQQTGYVLAPWQQMDVEGWRKNLSEVAAFEFTSLGDSYAARTGRPDNVGIIGVAVFRERRPAPQPQPHYRQDEIARQAPASPPASADTESAAGNNARRREGARDPGRFAGISSTTKPRESLGTGHGQREWSSARQVAFERASSTPFEVVALNYDSHENLVAIGVIPQPHGGAPQPFPMGFVPDPR